MLDSVLLGSEKIEKSRRCEEKEVEEEGRERVDRGSAQDCDHIEEEIHGQGKRAIWRKE